MSPTMTCGIVLGVLAAAALINVALTVIRSAAARVRRLRVRRAV
jgi:hypothetical protein